MGTLKKRWIALGTLAIAGTGCALWANKRLFIVHDVTTGESVAYPHLRSRVYYAEPAAVLAAARQAIRTLPRMRVVFADTTLLSMPFHWGTGRHAPLSVPAPASPAATWDRMPCISVSFSRPWTTG